jgi:hypothetical protein
VNLQQILGSDKVVLDEWREGARIGLWLQGRGGIIVELNTRKLRWPSAKDERAGCKQKGRIVACLNETQRRLIHCDIPNGAQLSLPETAVPEGSSAHARELEHLLHVDLGSSYSIVGSINWSKCIVNCLHQPRRGCVPRCIDGTVGLIREYKMIPLD